MTSTKATEPEARALMEAAQLRQSAFVEVLTTQRNDAMTELARAQAEVRVINKLCQDQRVALTDERTRSARLDVQLRECQAELIRLQTEVTTLEASKPKGRRSTQKGEKTPASQ